MIALIELAGGGIGMLMAEAEYHYTQPFVQPLYRAWDFWYLLLIPLCLAVAIVYKSVKCHSMRTVPREAAITFFWIVGGIAIAAVALAGLLRIM